MISIGFLDCLIQTRQGSLKKQKSYYFSCQYMGFREWVKIWKKLAKFSNKWEGESATPVFPIKKKNNKNKTWAWILLNIHF